MNIIDGTKDNFNELINEEKVLVQFHATWCGPCKMLMPITKGIAEEEIVKVVMVDIDENIELAQKYNIMSVPTLILFSKGEVKAETKGYMSKDALVELINNN
jgi:thioredoxin